MEQNKRYLNLPEDLCQPLYDRVHYPKGGVEELNFFSLSRGMTAILLGPNGIPKPRMKNFQDTNLECSNTLSTKIFKMLAINISISHKNERSLDDNFSDKMIVSKNGTLRLRIVVRDMFHIPLSMIPCITNSEMWSYLRRIKATDLDLINRMFSQHTYKLEIPLTINPYENFSLDVLYGDKYPVKNPLDISIVLSGYIRMAY